MFQSVRAIGFRLLLALAILLAGATYTQAQSLVSGQVTDADGFTWNNGTYTFTSRATGQAPISGSLDSGGAYSSVSIPHNAATGQVGEVWTLKTCPSFNYGCYSTTQAISGATVTLNQTPPAIRFSAVDPYQKQPAAYGDIEITRGYQGFQYYNVTLALWRSCTLVSAGVCTWANSASSGGGGNTTSTALTTGYDTEANDANSIVNSTCDHGVTTASTMTCSDTLGVSFKALAVPGDGTHAGIASVVGNTTVPNSLPSNSVGFLGPNSASFTSYFLQFPSTAPSANFLQCAAPSSNVSACTWASAGAGLVNVPAATSTNLIAPTAASVVGLTARQTTGTAAHMQDWQDSSNNIVGYINSTGANAVTFVLGNGSAGLSSALQVFGSVYINENGASTGGSFNMNSTADEILNAGSNANTNAQGVLAISSSTTASFTFLGQQYAHAPVCVVTPTSDPTAVGVWWVTTSTTTLTVTVKVSGTISFNYVCFGHGT